MFNILIPDDIIIYSTTTIKVFVFTKGNIMSGRKYELISPYYYYSVLYVRPLRYFRIGKER